MKFLKTLPYLVLIIGIQLNIKAETWNEPWQKEVIKKAEYFVLAKVISNNDSVGTEINIVKHFGEQELSGKVLINGFSQLYMMSSSGQGVHLNFEEGQLIYFLLTKRKEGNYAIATPTSGFAVLDNKNIYATYRHSYHQAKVPQEIYESTYSEIWNYYKTSKFDKEKMMRFINNNINKKPAGFEETEISTFFLQHVAMETAYLLDLTIELSQLEKFINSDIFHSKVSALQLLSNSNNKNSKLFLYEYIKNDSNENFEKVIAIWSLIEIGGQKYKRRLKKIADNLSSEYTGFGGNLMDPRVGTIFPSPQEAAKKHKKKY